MKHDETHWHTAAQAYLARLGRAEWIAQGKPVPTRRSPHRRFCPSDYMRALISCLDRNDEEAFKAIKIEQGYASALRV